MLLSSPARQTGSTRDDLVCLADLFAIATGVALGRLDRREGVDVLGFVEGRAPGRDHLIGLCGTGPAGVLTCG